MLSGRTVQGPKVDCSSGSCLQYSSLGGGLADVILWERGFFVPLNLIFSFSIFYLIKSHMHLLEQFSIKDGPRKWP